MLSRLARAGVDAARAVWKCPGLPALLMRLVKAPRPAADPESPASASYERRWLVMRCLRDICSWHRVAGLELRDAGEPGAELHRLDRH